MAITAVMVANLFNGLNTNVWTGWVFFAVFVGIVLVWLYTVSPTKCFSLVFSYDHCVGNLFPHFSWLVCHPCIRK